MNCNRGGVQHVGGTHLWDLAQTPITRRIKSKTKNSAQRECLKTKQTFSPLLMWNWQTLLIASPAGNRPLSNIFPSPLQKPCFLNKEHLQMHLAARISLSKTRALMLQRPPCIQTMRSNSSRQEACQLQMSWTGPSRRMRQVAGTCSNSRQGEASLTCSQSIT